MNVDAKRLLAAVKSSATAVLSGNLYCYWHCAMKDNMETQSVDRRRNKRLAGTLGAGFCASKAGRCLSPPACEYIIKTASHADNSIMSEHISMM